LCMLSGSDPSLSGDVRIPGFKKIGDFTYRVDEIGAEAFKNNKAITSVRIGEGVRRIRRMAFYGCDALTTVSTPATLNGIDAAAFNSCPSLTDIYLRAGLTYIETAAFAASYKIGRIYYELDAEDFALVAGNEALSAVEKVYNTVDSSLSVTLPLSGGFEIITDVTVDGSPVEYTLKMSDGRPVAINLNLARAWQYNGKIVTARGILPEHYSDFNGGKGGSISARGLVEGCKIAAAYDGRIFLSGSSALPSVVFYAARTRDGEILPTYFGEYSYFTDGSRANPVVSLLSVGGGLYVFKAKDDPMGEIFLHIGEDTGDDVLPRIYPVKEAFSGEYAVGATFAAADGPVFLSARGLSAIEKRSTNLERDITVRSSNIQTHLLREDLSEAKILDWMGYIAVAVGSKIFLADPRTTFVGRSGNIEYEWFLLDGVGGYTGKSQIFRYASYKTHPVFHIREGMEDEIVTEEVSQYTGVDRTYYAVRIGDVGYAVYPTEEYTYTGFIPAENYCTVNGVIAFTAGNGIYLFNNRMRGMPPTADYLTDRGITGEEYREAYGDRLHPSYYSFDGIAPRYVLRTVKTDCGVPHLTKSSVKSSLTVKLGAMTSAMPTLSVTTDRGEYREFVEIGGSCLDFLELDFSTLALCPEMDNTVAVAEKEKGWVEKDICIHSEKPSAPLAVMGMAFRYKIKGRIKHT
ncbi:MAG: leucine-rich repeat domain-containing protein, partial [Clostridia bacterium]|nr:leucine-rich repeat domain-containing protein [Clostridia bacterium]